MSNDRKGCWRGCINYDTSKILVIKLCLPNQFMEPPKYPQIGGWLNYSIAVKHNVQNVFWPKLLQELGESFDSLQFCKLNILAIQIC